MENTTSAYPEKLYSDWDRFWEKENVTILGKIMTKYRMDLYRKTIKKLHITSAIDVGCGYGMSLKMFEELGLKYEGIDVSENSVNFCKKMGLNSRLNRLEDETGQYDLVESEGMLEHFLNFEPFARHLMRISKKYVLIMQPNHDSLSGRTLVYLARLLRGKVLMYEYNYRMQDFIDVFDRHGFKVIENVPVFFDTSRMLLFERESRADNQNEEI